MPETLESIIKVVVALLGAYAAAFWFCLVVWTFRDIQKRSQDVIVQIFATLLVLLFNLPGLLLYTILRPPETLAEAYARSLEEESLMQDIEERQSCPQCRHRVRPDYMLCPNCHFELKKACASCRGLLQIAWDVCPFCGHTQTGSTRPSRGTTAA